MSFERPWTSSGLSNASRSTDDINSTLDLDTGLRRTSVSRGRPNIRRSVTEHHLRAAGLNTTFPNASSTEIMSPPMYEDAAELPLPKARFKVVPRDEEGQECLPTYTCSVRREFLFERKMEMTGPFEKAADRSWNKVYAVLNNTVLSIYKPKKAFTFSSSSRHITDDDRLSGYSAGTLLKSFTLQHAEIGAATDYKKRHYAIRIRAETQQFLLACSSVDVFLDWLEALACGVDLALPLEERALPQYQTIPRRRRRRRAQEIVQQQEEIIRQHFPQLLRTSDDESNPAHPSSTESLSRRTTSSNMNVAESSLVESANVPDMEEITPVPSINIQSDNEEAAIVVPEIVEPPTSPSLQPPHRPSISRSVSAPVTVREHDVHTPTPQPSREPERVRESRNSGKWRGCSNVSREAHLRFARRCMAVLTADAPRQSDYVMHQGMRYKIDQDLRGIVPDASILLPTYESHKSFGNVPLRS